MSKTSLTVIACALLLCAGTAQARLSAQVWCEMQKLDANGELQECLKQNSADILAGRPDASAKCQKDFTKALALADAAAARAGTSCRYLDNGDGTVSDLNTGLMWEEKTGTAGGSPDATDVHNVNNTYTWSSSGEAPDGTAFTTFLYGLNGGTSSNGVSTSGCFAGHCDWRLPIIEELAGIVDLSATGCGSGSPCIDPTFGPTQSYAYWSATTEAGYPGYAWYVFFGHGNVGYNVKPNDFYVRAVRSGL